MPNQHVIDWSMREQLQFPLVRVPLATGLPIANAAGLPEPTAMFKTETRGLLLALEGGRPAARFTVIGVVADNLGVEGLHNVERFAAKARLGAFLRKAFYQDAFFPL